MTIRQIQALLDYLGYNPGVVDGVNGPLTAAAVKAFQTAAGLTADGIPGLQTQAALKAAVSNDRFAPDQSAPASGQPPDTGGHPHITRKELRCNCGGKHCDGFPEEPSETLMCIAERVREHFGRPVIISSGVRCPTHNANVGGVANSRHLSGKAVDFRVQGVSGATVLAYCQGLVNAGELRYAYRIKNGDYVHMDVQ